MPVGLENFLKPEGHSGHCKLHVVVGSIEIDAGIPL